MVVPRRAAMAILGAPPGAERGRLAGSTPPMQFICLFVHLFIGSFVYLFICLFVHLFICVFVYLFICLFVYLSICLFVHLFICLFEGQCHHGAARR